MVNQVIELIDWITMDLDNIKIKRACKLLGINTIEICNINRQDFLDKTFLEILLNEFNEIRNALHHQMDMESTIPEHQFCGGYMPSDIWIEAEIELNTIIENITQLLNRLLIS